MALHQHHGMKYITLPHIDDDLTDSTCSTHTSTSSFSSLSDSLNNFDYPPQHHQNAKKVCKSVSFDSVTVREYNRIAGDHPGCLEGPPMSLDWNFVEHDPVTIEHYDDKRNDRRRGIRAVSSEQRKAILKEGFGVSEDEILCAERRANKAARKRELTRQRLEFACKTHRLLKNITRWLPLFRSPVYTEYGEKKYI